ncbi:M81 family metallopeptidase [Salinarimonas ramus]|uniref:Microcystinase C n=1 Tax=Salinarimonas ramus TaxID=690164 RepID=A0A917V280_9HYPH|nr:M81 family metallopeptidase [Salinarimonas ramus]GGK26167.1 microcystinase C [Salinarimonas ramus]
MDETTPGPRAKRVAIGGFMHETNTFAATKAGLDAFRHGGGWPPLTEGAEALAAVRGVNVGMAGALAYAEDAGWELVPTIWAAASPSAHVTREAFETVAERMLARIAQAGPLDGIVLDLHGAMVTEHLDDGEVEIVARVRALVGPDVPIVASLDLHGNIGERLVADADALVAYRTYPHVDMADTGTRAAALLGRLMAGERFAKAFRQLPFLIPVPWQCTDLEPARTLYAGLAALESDDRIAALSLLMGFPAADIPECGPSILAYAAGEAAADAAAQALETAFLAAEPLFAGEALAPDAAVARARAILAERGGTVVVADTQDNPGAGGDANTTGLLRALVEANVENAAIGVLVDRAAAQAAHAAGEGARITLTLPGSGLPGDPPFTGAFLVERLSDGIFTADGPYYGGTRMRLGPSAALRIGGVRLVLASEKAQAADRAMFGFVGIVPEETGIVCVKSSVHFRADFAPIATEILVCAAPGPMPVDPRDLPFTRLRPGLRLAPRTAET